jgi:Bacterial flagellin N-terminal helical region./Bacterial flagellin C-terminal helical region.
MIINHNIAALNTYRQLTVNNTATGKSLEKLSSGYRINRAGDDAAGLAISEKMRSQIRGLNQAIRNAQDGISLIQTAEGALTETHAMLQRMRELAVQAANGTNTDADLEEIQKEISQLREEIDRIAEKTQFNTKPLLDGTYDSTKPGSTEIVFQIGPNQETTMKINIASMKAVDLGKVDFSDAQDGSDIISINDIKVVAENENEDVDFDKIIQVIDKAIAEVSAQRSQLGAYQNRLEHTINNLNASAENLTAAESRIRDADMAKEMMEFTKNSILQQAAQAMLAQAMQQPQSVLQLLR